VRQPLSGNAWGLVTVCVVGLAARLLFATVLVPYFEQRARVAPDPDRYADLAASLLDRGTLGFSPPGASPTSLRGPAFPSWLAAGLAVGGRSDRWIALWASIPGLIASLALAAALRKTHGPRAGLIGGLLCAAHPLACFVSARVLPDEFYGSLLILALLTFHQSSEAGSTRRIVLWASLTGVLLSAAAMTRATALVVLVAIVALCFWSRPRRVLAGAVVVIVAASLLGAWTWRTSSLVGRPAFVESLAGYNFWLGEAADRFGFAGDFGRARERAHELMAAEAGTPETRSPSFHYVTLAPRDAREFDEKLVRAGVRSIATRPLAYARRVAAGLFWFWVRAETATRTLQYALVALPLVALGLFGLSRSSSRLLLLIVVAHVVVYAAICPMARYSVQLYPLLCYLAGIGISRRGPEIL
jgi:4-amino-4-deoxy-L-arabinose transferase-like glycosyltransferase